MVPSPYLYDFEKCDYCKQLLEAVNGDKKRVFGPYHTGSRNCRSGSLAAGGKNAHCTCDTCF